VLNLNYEVTESEGFINNPYRQVRYLDSQEPWLRLPEGNLSSTRSGNAAAATVKYYLPWRAAATGSYRFYSDTFGINANTGELGYTQPIFRAWTVDSHLRYYHQTHADFYSDLFPYANAQNFLARDRELAAFGSYTIGIIYRIPRQSIHGCKKAPLTCAGTACTLPTTISAICRSRMWPPGPPHTLNADILQAFVSFWF
jgi:hypothetical protein